MKLFEVEQKFKVRHLAPIRRKLRFFKAKKIKSGVESNEFFDRCSELRKKKLALRLRRNQKGKWFLTLKGPRLPYRYSKRLELEMEVDGRTTKAILNTLGFKRIAHYQKKREEFKVGKALICLDQVPRLGTFVEIEGPAQDIGKIQKKLGFTVKNREEKSYFSMLFPKLYRTS